MVNAFNSSTSEAEAGLFVRSRSAWQDPGHLGLQGDPDSREKKTTTTYTQTKHTEKGKKNQIAEEIKKQEAGAMSQWSKVFTTLAEVLSLVLGIHNWWLTVFNSSSQTKILSTNNSAKW